eukprot:4284752-Prymnesium_polylepis.1
MKDGEVVAIGDSCDGEGGGGDGTRGTPCATTTPSSDAETFCTTVTRAAVGCALPPIGLENNASIREALVVTLALQ